MSKRNGGQTVDSETQRELAIGGEIEQLEQEKQRLVEEIQERLGRKLAINLRVAELRGLQRCLTDEVLSAP